MGAGAKADQWENVWRQHPFGSDRQVAKLANTPQWRAMTPWITQGASVLEAGCGLGTWVRFFKQRGLNPTGIDFSVETVGRLKQEFKELSWDVGDITELPYASDSFDLLVSWGVIEHFEEGPMEAINEMFRVVRPGGHAFFTVPWLSPYRLKHGYSNPGSNLHEFPADTEPKFAQYFMTKEELVGFVSEAGFTPIDVSLSSIKAKSLFPFWFRKSYPLATKILNRLMSPILPNSLIASMVLVVARK